MYTISAALNDPNCTNDDRFNVLYENLKMLEKKMDKDLFVEPFPVVKKRHVSFKVKCFITTIKLKY